MGFDNWLHLESGSKLVRNLYKLHNLILELNVLMLKGKQEVP